MTQHSPDPTDTSTTASTPAPARVDPGHATVLTREARLVIYLILFAAFVVILNETTMTVALPKIMDDLRITPASGQWLTTAFMLTMAIVIPLSGFFLKRFPLRAVFITAISLFTIGTAIAAIAPGFGPLLLGRVVQATGTGVMMPLLMTTVMTLVPPHERGRMMGNLSIVISVAPALGPTISGFIVSSLSWRWVFLVMIPIAIAALVIGALKITNVTETERHSVDVLSIIMSAFAFGALVFGLSSIGEAAAGHELMHPAIPIVFGLVMLALFLWRQSRLQRDDRALLDLRVFQARGFTPAFILMSCTTAMLFGVIILLPLYLQTGLMLEPEQAGLMMLPGSLLMGFAGPFVGRLYDRIGPRPLVIAGSVGAALTMWATALAIGETTPWGVVLALNIAMCATLALLFTPIFTSAMAAVPPKLYPFGSAWLGTIQQLAGAAGTATLIVIYTVSMTSQTGSPDAAGTPGEVSNAVHVAMIGAAIIATISIVPALFVRRAEDEVGAPARAHH